MIDAVYISLAALSGTALGSVASSLSNWATMRRQDRIRHKTKAVADRQKLYKKFIDEASRLYADALANDPSEISKLVSMYALIGRMRVLSRDHVIEAAEKAGHLIIEAYLSPNRTFADLTEVIKEMDPLREFSEACRRDLQAAQTVF
jgi:hypothetical protein